MNGKTVAILENRYGEQLAELLAKRGARPVRAPALAELPDFDREDIARLVAGLEAEPPYAFIFQTGVGTRALFDATDALGLTDRLLGILAQATVVARGPKPAGPLRVRGVSVALSAREPYTTAEVLQAMDGMALRDRSVVVQRYGGANTVLDRALAERGARVVDVPLYRWSLPADTKPLADLMDALGSGHIDAVAFTNAAQARNLFALADGLGRRGALAAGLGQALVASIGPVCTRALEECGVKVGVEANPPKLGPFVEALAAAMAA